MLYAQLKNSQEGAGTLQLRTHQTQSDRRIVSLTQEPPLTDEKSETGNFFLFSRPGSKSEKVTCEQ